MQIDCLNAILQITKPSRASFIHDVQKRSIVSSSEALLRVGKQCFVFEDHASLLKTPPQIITTPGQLRSVFFNDEAFPFATKHDLK